MSWTWLLVLLVLGLVAGFVFGAVVRRQASGDGPTLFERARAWVRARLLAFLWPGRSRSPDRGSGEDPRDRKSQ
jgi:hypothetical protein